MSSWRPCKELKWSKPIMDVEKANAAMSSANTWYVLEPEKFRNLRNAFPDQKKFELLTRKGVFPFDWLNDMERLNETQLPPKSVFYSKLDNEHISDENYEHARRGRKDFG